MNAIIRRLARAACLLLALFAAGCGGGGDADEASAAAREQPQGNPAPGDLFVSPSGDNANPGTQASPKRSIAAAAALLAGTGKTVWLLDGSYTLLNQGASAASVPSGVHLQAYNALQATLRIRLDLQGDNNLRELKFVNVRPAITATIGKQYFTDLRFVETVNQQTDAGALEIGGTASARLSAGRNPDFAFIEPGMRKFARVYGSGKLRIVGGAIEGSMDNSVTPDGAGYFEDAVLVVKDSASLDIDGTTVNNWSDLVTSPYQAGTAIWVLGNSQVDIRNALVESDMTLMCQGASCSVGSTTLRGDREVVWLEGTAAQSQSLQLTNSTIEGRRWGLRAGGSSSKQIDIDGVSLIDTGIEFWGGGPTKVAVNGLDMQTGVQGILQSPYSISGGRSLYAPLDFKLRNSVLVNEYRWAMLLGTNGTLDLGTAAHLGGNTIIGSDDPPDPDNVCGLHLRRHAAQTGTVLVEAVGNTWRPHTQGSDWLGKYYAIGSATVVEVSGIACPTGGNFGVPSGVTLRLAQKPRTYNP